jgi:hypothetical protein
MLIGVTPTGCIEKGFVADVNPKEILVKIENVRINEMKRIRFDK